MTDRSRRGGPRARPSRPRPRTRARSRGNPASPGAVGRLIGGRVRRVGRRLRGGCARRRATNEGEEDDAGVGRASTPRSGLVVAADREGVRAARGAGDASRRAGTGSRRAPWRTRRGGCGAARAGEVWASGTARVARDLQRPRWRQATSTSQPVDSIKRNPIGARRSFTSSMNLRPPSVIAPREIVAPAQFVQRTTLGVATRARRASSGRDGERGVHADGGGRDAAEHGQRGAFARAARPLPRSAPRVSSARGCSRGTTDRGWSESARPPIPTPLRP